MRLEELPKAKEETTFRKEEPPKNLGDEETVRHDTVYGARDTYVSTENPMLEGPRKRKEPISIAKKGTKNIMRGRTAEVSDNKEIRSQASSRA